MFSMVAVLKFGVMVLNMKVTGEMAWLKEKEPFITQTEMFKLVNIIKIKQMASENIDM